MQETADLVTFTEKILNGKLHFLCSVIGGKVPNKFIGETYRQSSVSPLSFMTPIPQQRENSIQPNP